MAGSKKFIKGAKFAEAPRGSRGLMKMTESQFIKTLDESRIFNSFTHSEKVLLSKLSSNLLYHKKGEYIIHEGDQGKALYIILKGSVDVTKNVDKAVIVANLGPGEIFGEISVFLDRVRNSNVVAVDEVISLRIDMPLLKKMGDAIEKKFYFLAIETLATKLDKTNNALIEVHKALSKVKNFSIANLQDDEADLFKDFSK